MPTFNPGAATPLLLLMGVVASVAVHQILLWFDSDAFHATVIGCSVLAVALTLVSIANVFKSSRRAPHTAAT